MKFWTMWLRGVLQMSVLLVVGLCHAHKVHAAGDGKVPGAQLRMLSLGLTHMLQGVEENAQQMEQQVEQVARELDGASKSLEGLRKQSLQAGRTRKQVRKDLQILSARGDRLWRAARDLQKGADELETEQGAMQLRINQVLLKVKSLTQPTSGGHTQLDLNAVKVIMDKQARRLANLASEVSARDRMIDRRLRHIDHLEKKVSERTQQQ